MFGSIASRNLGAAGHKIHLFEATESLLSRASLANQARLHTGMHYPRDFETASNAKRDHDLFAEAFRPAVRDVSQLYAIANDSKVSFSEFQDFAIRLGHEPKALNPSTWFRPGTIQGLLGVMESSFDSSILSGLLSESFSSLKNVEIHYSTPVLGIADGHHPSIRTTSGTSEFDLLIVSSYAMNSKFAQDAGVSLQPYENQLTEIALGKFPGLENMGITVMDGDYWSTMPFGQTGLHSLSHVKLTPMLSKVQGLLPCQEAHSDCGVGMIYACGPCAFRPASRAQAMQDAMESYLLPEMRWQPVRSMFTVKSLPHGARFRETAARPTDVVRSPSGNVLFVHSGKIGSSLHLADSLVDEMKGR